MAGAPPWNVSDVAGPKLERDQDQGPLEPISAGAGVVGCIPKDNREHVLGADARPRRRGAGRARRQPAREAPARMRSRTRAGSLRCRCGSPASRRVPEAGDPPDLLGRAGARHRRARRARTDLPDPRPARRRSSARPSTCTRRSAHGGWRPRPASRHSCRTRAGTTSGSTAPAIPIARAATKSRSSVALGRGVRLLGRDHRAAPVPNDPPVRRGGRGDGGGRGPAVEPRARASG